VASALFVAAQAQTAVAEIPPIEPPPGAPAPGCDPQQLAAGSSLVDTRLLSFKQPSYSFVRNTDDITAATETFHILDPSLGTTARTGCILVEAPLCDPAHADAGFDIDVDGVSRHVKRIDHQTEVCGLESGYSS